MDPVQIKTAAYGCLEQFFIFVNEAGKTLHIGHDRNFRVTNFTELKGVDLFWQIAFNVTDPEVKEGYHFGFEKVSPLLVWW